MTDYQLTPEWPLELAGYVIKLPSLMIGPASDGWQEYQDWLAAGNIPAPARALTPSEEHIKRIAAGLTITSISDPTLNATYAIDLDSQQTITGIYSGIRGGDGVPAGGSLFGYADMSATVHLFSAVTFAAFAKAVRDYLYGLNVQAHQPSPVWPTATATIA